MEQLFDTIINTSNNEEIQSLLKQIKDIEKVDLNTCEKNIIDIINEIVLKTRKLKSKRILIPVDNRTNISITSTSGIATSWSTYSGDRISDITKLKDLVLNTNAFKIISGYLTADGQKEFKKAKDIVNKYTFNAPNYDYNNTITIKEELKLLDSEKSIVLKEINTGKVFLMIKNDYGSTSICISDTSHTSFDFDCSDTNNDNYIISLALANKYPKELISGMEHFMEKYRKKFPNRITCSEELQHEFSKYMMLKMI